VQEIADWLGRLGLGQYAQRFAENEIDVSILPHLADQDLKDINIPLGHRRKPEALADGQNDEIDPTRIRASTNRSVLLTSRRRLRKAARHVAGDIFSH
jgi:hypothetical protein